MVKCAGTVERLLEEVLAYWRFKLKWAFLSTDHRVVRFSLHAGKLRIAAPC
jgi:hypothetical protein